jgi:uncharacterized protein (DUF362 family)
MTQRSSRRDALAAGLSLATGCTRWDQPVAAAMPSSPVAILRAADYSIDLVAALREGARLCKLKLHGRRVLIKPNLVEFDRATAINTDARLVAAVVELVRSLGAAEVTIGEGPGHRRDTLGLAEEAGYFREIPGFERLFVDLNRDDVVARPGFLDGGRIYLPASILDADVVISVPKLKTHHWAGVTLSMKNLFGVVPGAVYGWPKNPLHYAGIDRSIVELNRLFRNTFAIVDGIVGMEGNGPIQGLAKALGVIVMSPDVVAADSTCARLMGIAPGKIGHLHQCGGLGNWEENRIVQRGEQPASVMRRFELPPGLEEVRAAHLDDFASTTKAFC